MRPRADKRLKLFNVKMLVQEISKIINGKLIGDASVEITRVADILAAKSGDISFLEKAEKFTSTNASCVITDENTKLNCTIIRVKNPKLAFAKIAEILHPQKLLRGISKHSIIHKTAKIGKNVFVGNFALIGENSIIGEGSQTCDGVKIGGNVSIGKNSVIHSNCVIYENVSIGENCIIHAGTIIGADGFGYVRDQNSYVKFPQIGTVVIENNVEIGANSCVDRGALGETRIGEGTKIDNLVQVAHNVTIGKRVIIAAQTGISGSTIIEDDVVIGGQVGIGDHARILSGAIIGSQAGILPNKIVRAGVWWGTPVQPLEDYKRQNAMVKGLGRLRDEVKSIGEIVRRSDGKTE
jgi:UDP-3-O-[3-hydroxymyristoyl] glucosamine N-acyltransferase